MLAAAALLASLRVGGEVAVEAATVAIERLFPSAEQVERMEEIQAPHRWTGAETNERIYPISGVIRTHDGSPLPEKIRLTIYSAGSSFSMLSADTEGKFSIKVAAGTYGLMFDLDGFAPLEVRIDPSRLADHPELDLTLTAGFTGRFKLVGPEDEPVAGAKLSGGFPPPEGGGYSHSSRLNLETDSAGIARVDHATTQPLNLTVEADGYEYLSTHRLRLDPERPVEIRLARSAPVEGLVLDARDGRPIPGARINLLYATLETPGRRESHGFGSNQRLAVSDEQGRFTITTLRAGWSHEILISAEDHEEILLEGVTTQSGPIEARLGPPLYLRGRIVGPLETLGNRKLLHIKVTGSMEEQAEVKLEPTEDGASFRIDNLRRGTTRLRIGSREDPLWEREIEVTEPIEDFVIDLDQLVAGPSRQVQFVFDLPADAPPPRGQLRLSRNKPGGKPNHFAHYRYIDLATSGPLVVDVPMPTRLHVESDGIIGYWFERFQHDVPEGEAPLVVSIPLRPAGLIHGRIVTADGTLRGINGTLEVIERPADTLWFTGDSPRPDAAGRFATKSLPLDGLYRVRFSRGSTYVLSEPIRLTAEQPIVEVELKMPEGLPVRGRVVSSAGEPLAGIRLELSLITIRPDGERHGSTHGSETTDEAGEYVFEGVNPDVPGHYEIRVSRGQVWQPVVEIITPGGPPLELRVKRGHTVSGVVLDAVTGHPIEGLRVFCRAQPFPNQPDPTAWNEALAPTDAQGQFEMRGLAARTYRITIHPPEGRTFQHDFEPHKIRGTLELRM